jgi:hypothetical protein
MVGGEIVAVVVVAYRTQPGVSVRGQAVVVVW